MYSNFTWTEVSKNRNIIQRSYEPLQIYFLIELASFFRCNRFIDVGANIGSYSFGMQLVESIKHVQAFEPMPAVFEEFKANIALNRLEDKISIQCVAISDQEGTAPFATINRYSGANGLLETWLQERTQSTAVINVPVKPLDDIIREPRELEKGPICIKIDVEGHEAKVLAGASRVLDQECIVQLEVYQSCESGKADVDALLAKHGFVNFWSIGADRYYCKANNSPSSIELLDLISAAHQKMIDDFRSIEIPGICLSDGSISRRFGPVRIEIFDPLASTLRRFFRR